MYLIRKRYRINESAGPLEIVRLVNGTEEKAGLEEPLAKTFHQVLALCVGRRPPYDRLVESKEELIEECKSSGIILHAGLSGTAVGFRHTMMKETGHGGSAIVNLNSVVCATNESNKEPAEENGRPSIIWISEFTLSEIDSELDSDDSPRSVRRVTNRPIDRTFVYIDVSDFSKYSSEQQSLIPNSLVRIVKEKTRTADPD